MSVASLPPETPDIETSSDDYARRFSGAAGAYFLKVQEQAIKRALTGCHGSTVLEVGGGHGQLVPIFLRQGRELTILGSDDSTHRRVRECYPEADIQYETGNILELPYRDRSFDVVVAVRLISHIDQWQTLLREFCRVARHSIIIDYPRWISLNAFTPLFFKMKQSLEGNTRSYTSFFRSDLEKAFQQHDFNVVSSWNQFFVPMLVHRSLNGAQWLQTAECAFRWSGLTRLLGSPGVLRAERMPHPDKQAER